MDTLLLDRIVLDLLLWIGLNSGYDVTLIDPPEIRELSAVELTREAYSDHPERLPDSGVDPRINALYDPDHGQGRGLIHILSAEYFQSSMDPFETPRENPVFQEIVLHELIHHVQYKSGMVDEMACRNAAEKDAYLLGGLFLKKRYVEDPLPNRHFWARVYSRC